MKKNSVEERIGCIFTGDQVSRIHIEEDHDVVTEVEADVHGMSCSEARLFLHNLIALLRFPFKLIVIHGTFMEQLSRRCYTGLFQKNAYLNLDQLIAITG